MLEQPAGEAIEQPRQDWPESTETRQLQVNLTDEEIVEESRSLVRHLREVQSLESQKKASNDRFKAQIEEQEKLIEDLKTIVNSGKTRRDVSCSWQFEMNGHAAGGDRIPHSGMKTLIRDDTNETIKVKPITDEDRQLLLGLSYEESMEANLAAIESAGHTLAETDPESDSDAPFTMRDRATGEEFALYADSLAEAVKEGRAILEQEAEATVEEAITE